MHCSHLVCKWWGTSKEGKWKVLWGETGTNISTWNTCWWTVRVHKGVSLLSRWWDDQHLLHSDLFKVWIESEHVMKHIIMMSAGCRKEKRHALPWPSTGSLMPHPHCHSLTSQPGRAATANQNIWLYQKRVHFSLNCSSGTMVLSFPSWQTVLA